MTNYSAGKLAEFLACGLLKTKGYKIVARNYKTGKGTHAGEIDIIAKKDNLLVFVEVKKRKTLENAAYAISETQKSRIKKGAEAFLALNPQFENYDMRFDAILIAFPLDFQHIENAWF